MVKTASRYVPARSADPASPTPRIVLTTFQLSAMMFVALIGGAYGLEGCVRTGGPLLTIIAVGLLCVCWGIPTAMVVAELGCALPSNAGPSLWLSVTYSRWFVFVNVLWMIVNNMADNGLYPILFADYVGSLLPELITGTHKIFLKLAMIVFSAVINILGVDIVGDMSVLFTVGCCMPFVLLFALQAMTPVGILWHNVAYVPPTVNWTIFLATLAWNTSGFENVGNLTEEVKVPEKSLFLGLVGCLCLTCGVYIPPVLAGISVATDLTKYVDGYWVVVAHMIGGRSLAVLMCVGGVVSSVGLLTTLLCTTSRALSGMGTINVFPGPISDFLARLHPKYQTPVNAIIVNSILSGAFAMFLEFDTIIMVDSTLYCLKLLAIYVAAIKLRVLHPSLPRPFQFFKSTLFMGIVLTPSILFCGGMFVVMVTMSRSTCYIVGTVMGVSIVLSLIYGAFVQQEPLLGHVETFEVTEKPVSYGGA